MKGRSPLWKMRVRGERPHQLSWEMSLLEVPKSIWRWVERCALGAAGECGVHFRLREHQ